MYPPPPHEAEILSHKASYKILNLKRGKKYTYPILDKILDTMHSVLQKFMQPPPPWVDLGWVGRWFLHTYTVNLTHRVAASFDLLTISLLQAFFFVH